MQITEYFDKLVNHGLSVIPLRENSKAPLLKGWQDNWDENFCRYLFEKNPNLNFGFLLGEIVDVEGDTEQSNRLIHNLIGNFPHPSYKSSKSVHHLFKTPDSTLRRLCCEGVEFRGYRHQSVLPPSRHADGTKYKWIDITFPVPEMPTRLKNFYFEITKKGEIIKPRHMKVNCFICREKCYIHKKRFNLELQAFKTLELAWQCHKCRKHDLRSMCRQLRAN